MKLVYIEDKSARKATFTKRKKGVMKKVRELSTLCGIQACAIVNNPFDKTQPPETWPPTLGEVHQVLNRFKNMPTVNQRKKMVSQEKFLIDRIKKTADQTNKYYHDNCQKEVDLAVTHCLTGRMELTGLTLNDYDLISQGINRKIQGIDQRLAELSRGDDRRNAQVAPQVANYHGNGGGGDVQGMDGQHLLTEAMMNPTAASAPAIEDELMTMLMMMQQGSGTGDNRGVGESSSNVEAMSISNSNSVWSNSDPFFDWDF